MAKTSARGINSEDIKNLQQVRLLEESVTRLSLSHRGQLPPWEYRQSFRNPDSRSILFESTFMSHCQFSQGGSRRLGDRLSVASDFSTVQAHWRFFLSSLSITPGRKLSPGEKISVASDSPNRSDLLEIFLIFVVDFPSTKAVAWGKNKCCFRFPQQA